MIHACTDMSRQRRTSERFSREQRNNKKYRRDIENIVAISRVEQRDTRFGLLGREGKRSATRALGLRRVLRAPEAPAGERDPGGLGPSTLSNCLTH